MEEVGECARASRLGPAAPRRPHPPPRAPRRPPPPSRGAGIHRGARAPSFRSPPGSSILLPGFASFAFLRLPAPRQSDLRTQPRQRLPPRRETPPPAALRGRGGARGASRHGGAAARAPADGCRGKGPVPRDAEGLGWDLNPRPQILSGAGVGRGGQHRPAKLRPRNGTPAWNPGLPDTPFAPPAPLLERSQPYRAVAQGPPALPGASSAPSPALLARRAASPPPLWYLHLSHICKAIILSTLSHR